MRTLLEIQKDLDALDLKKEALKKEIRDFRLACPHPEPFIKTKYTESYDDCVGPGIYEYSTKENFCALCGAISYVQWDKKKEKEPGALGVVWK